MKRTTIVLLSLALGSGGVSVLEAAQDGSPASRTDSLVPGRRYQEGERLAYRMTGTNRHGDRRTSYEATASGIVKRDSIGRIVEEYDELEISLTNGRILSARMDNVVDVLERICVDEALEVCEDPTRYQIVREIVITEIRANGAARRPRISPG